MSVPSLRAPTEHGQILAVPGLDQVGDLLARNRRIISDNASTDQGKMFAEDRLFARRLVHTLSTKYHHESNEPTADDWPEAPQPLSPDERAKPWFVAGHQPELFHPGVWFKNFVLHHLARIHGAVVLNLIIDTDMVKPAVLHVPDGDKIRRVPIDRISPASDYEECTVQDEQLFGSVPERVAEIADSWGFKPLLDEYWQEVLKAAKRTHLLGERFGAARRALERRWGIMPREAPMSRVCQTPIFFTFLARILRGLDQLHGVYNEIVQDYRRTHGIRSRSHPVPDLARDGQWLETPFWAWRQGQTRRGKLFVRTTKDRWTLRIDRDNDCTWDADGVPDLIGHCSRGLRIRPRALTTTMFARLFLSDLFIHGIGGGIYDELTDRIIERFWGIEAPSYLIMSATLQLPLPRFPDAASRARTLGRRLRELQYQPERFVPRTNEVESLLNAKEDWIARDGVTHAERVQRFEQIRAINAQLQPHVAPELERTRAALVQCHREVGCEDVAARRDFPFCLYPETMLREFFMHNPQESLRSSWGLGGSS